MAKNTCLGCGKTSKGGEREGGVYYTLWQAEAVPCPHCGRLNVFGRFHVFQGGEVRRPNGAWFTDRALLKTAKALSRNGELRVHPRQLYYGLVRKQAAKHAVQSGNPGCALALGWLLFTFCFVFIAFVFLTFRACWGTGDPCSRHANPDWLPWLLLAGTSVYGLLWRVSGFWTQGLPSHVPRPPFEPVYFARRLERFSENFGLPRCLITRSEGLDRLQQQLERLERADAAPPRRALVCQKREVANFLFANGFHLQQACLIISPEDRDLPGFNALREHIRQDPRLPVFALHDAGADGCRLPQQIGNDDAWFNGLKPVTDIGLQPEAVKTIDGLHALPDLARKPEQRSRDEQKRFRHQIVELMALEPRKLLEYVAERLEQPDGPGAAGPAKALPSARPFNPLRKSSKTVKKSGASVPKKGE